MNSSSMHRARYVLVALSLLASGCVRLLDFDYQSESATGEDDADTPADGGRDGANPPVNMDAAYVDAGHMDAAPSDAMSDSTSCTIQQKQVLESCLEFVWEPDGGTGRQLFSQDDAWNVSVGSNLEGDVLVVSATQGRLGAIWRAPGGDWGEPQHFGAPGFGPNAVTMLDPGRAEVIADYGGGSVFRFDATRADALEWDGKLLESADAGLTEQVRCRDDQGVETTVKLGLAVTRTANDGRTELGYVERVASRRGDDLPRTLRSDAAGNLLLTFARFAASSGEDASVPNGALMWTMRTQGQWTTPAALLPEPIASPDLEASFRRAQSKFAFADRSTDAPQRDFELNAAGSAVFLWQRSVANAVDVVPSRFSFAAATWETGPALVLPSRPANVTYSIDEAGVVLLVFRSEQVIWWSQLDARGWTEPALVDTLGGKYDTIRLAKDARGGALLAWVDSSRNPSAVWSRHFEDGAWQTKKRAVLYDIGENKYIHHLSVDGRGEAVLIYSARTPQRYDDRLMSVVGGWR